MADDVTATATLKVDVAQAEAQLNKLQSSFEKLQKQGPLGSRTTPRPGAPNLLGPSPQSIKDQKAALSLDQQRMRTLNQALAIEERIHRSQQRALVTQQRAVAERRGGVREGARILGGTFQPLIVAGGGGGALGTAALVGGTVNALVRALGPFALFLAPIAVAAIATSV